jgi:hypothetical protein
MVDTIQKRVSDRPVTEQDVVETLNRELIPVIRQTLLALNMLLERYLEGEGSPEGVVTANPGALYQNTAGGVGTTLYYKASGTESTGWQAL